MIEGLHHIQLAMPTGCEDEAREFYCGVLHFTETPKPEMLLGRGGVWFEAGQVRVHLGVETPFTPAKKAHPGFQVASLDAVIQHLKTHGIEPRTDTDLPDIRRVYVNDPFGNRIELLELR
ncbi:catechol 2,3-dioxygenase-like lactoylglutathione lyase family enzyme [Litoreibacter meonggei]|uniref:Catechol 2,3-dioxygenase-like lactoylglutathione lyase family enzyme n=1 Tax=Litoreibacter meonggei TaxID=1049199 RepID=A0A497X4U5_9RHOB|nr:VOC family protein [Litoreibacter meonggei]RLJ60279.1 catechol 2,3-dioxygenase-like lactoylglutathione lyase family enzyme [Litoreibacter meonggei]